MPLVMTIGHSDRTLAAFIELLQAHNDFSFLYLYAGIWEGSGTFLTPRKML